VSQGTNQARHASELSTATEDWCFLSVFISAHLCRLIMSQKQRTPKQWPIAQCKQLEAPPLTRSPNYHSLKKIEIRGVFPQILTNEFLVAPFLLNEDRRLLIGSQ
jgi:hypothetical protein